MTDTLLLALSDRFEWCRSSILPYVSRFTIELDASPRLSGPFPKVRIVFPALFLSLPASLIYSTPANTDFSLHAIRHQIPA